MSSKHASHLNGNGSINGINGMNGINGINGSDGTGGGNSGGHHSRRPSGEKALEFLPNPCAGPSGPNEAQMPSPCANPSITIAPIEAPRESLMDRADILIPSTVLAVVMWYLVENWETSYWLTQENAPLLLPYKVSMPIVSIGLYLLMVHGLGPYLRRDPKVKSPAFFSESSIKVALKYWNFVLFLLSICMFIGLGAPTAVWAWEKGLWEAVCDSQRARWTGPQLVWMMTFTFSKYFELFDTAFMVVRRKEVSFLHWYHHASVLAYTWGAVVVGFAPGWYFAIINSFVHTVMYFYFYRAACGKRLTYDKLVTTLQLTQMVVGVSITLIWVILHYLVEGGEIACPCFHSEWVMFSALVIYGSYFLLFLSFYLARYREKKSKKAENKKIE